MRKRHFIMNIRCFQRNFSPVSSSLVPVQLPSQRETHLWYLLPDEVKTASILNQYLEILSPCEKESVHRLQGDELRKSALLARVLVRTTIARYKQVNPRSLKFRKNSYGKPEVEWNNEEERRPPLLHFNMSHTSSLIACGVTVGSPIGIDMEGKQRRTTNNILDVARRYFTHHEVEFLTSIPDTEIQRQEFIKLWTLKESYVKALGTGFSAAPFNTFTIQFRAATDGGCHLFQNSYSEASEIIVRSTDDATKLTSSWQFALLELAGSHYAAICLEKDKTITSNTHTPMRLTVRKTIPYVEDECVSGKNAVVAIGGLVEHFTLDVHL